MRKKICVIEKEFGYNEGSERLKIFEDNGNRIIKRTDLSWRDIPCLKENQCNWLLLES